MKRVISIRVLVRRSLYDRIIRKLLVGRLGRRRKFGFIEGEGRKRERGFRLGG